MLFALGLGARVIGDTTYCDYPPAARTKAKIGDVNANYEKILALRPDLIVASDANKTAATRLTSLRLPVLNKLFASNDNDIRTSDILTDADTPARRYIVTSAELSPLGWRIMVQQAVA